MAQLYPREAGRIAFLLERDGRDATIAWVQRVLRAYRLAVLNKHHFASTPYYRSRFIGAYCDFKRWLATVRREHRTGSRPAASRSTMHGKGEVI